MADLSPVATNGVRMNRRSVLLAALAAGGAAAIGASARPAFADEPADPEIETWEEFEALCAARTEPGELPERDTPLSAEAHAVKNSFAANLPPQSNVAGFYTSFISGQRQERSNWCGPAATTTYLTNWAVPGVSQATMAARMGTNSLGTRPWRIPRALDAAINAYYHYNGINNWITLHPRVDNNRLRIEAAYDVVVNRSVLIILVYSRKIWYPRASRAAAHYLVVYGYSFDWAGRGPTLLVWDPLLAETHHLSCSDWERVAYPGRWVIGDRF